MAKYSNQVVYDIKTTLDASGITKLHSELNKVQTALNSLNSSPKKLKSLGLNIDEVEEYRIEIEQLSRVLNTTFNTRTGMIDLNKFNAALHNGTLNAEKLGAAFNAAGSSGKVAFNSLLTSVTTLNKNAITANSALTKIANTFGNTVRWGITASIFQEMMSSVQGAVSYIKDLDESLTQIQMVTNSSKEDMRELAQYANNAAQALGSTTTDYTNAVKVFVQEGFSEKESKQYANLSTKLANVSEQNTATTSDQITAFRNAFQLDYEQTVAAMDKVANVANNTASNVNELMTASQRAASVAQAVGASQDSFLASIATIESVTRQSAEEIGNGLKTIYQRFADIKVGKSADDGVDYGQYAEALKSIGVDVLDAAGEFKGMDQILKETQEVWSGLSETMKVAVGEKVAGKFQYNRFAALMNNPEYYQKALGATQDADGMMDQMNEYYIESIEGRLNALQTAGEQVISTLFDQDNIEPVIGAATNFLNIINNIIDSVGGGLPVFTALSSILLRTFNAQIGEQVTRIGTNISTMLQGNQNIQQMPTALLNLEAAGVATDSKSYKFAKETVNTMTRLDSNTQQEWSNTIQKSVEAENALIAAEKKYHESLDIANAKISKRYKMEQSVLNVQGTIEEYDVEILKLEKQKGKEVEKRRKTLETEKNAMININSVLKGELIVDEELYQIDENVLKLRIQMAKALQQENSLSGQALIDAAKKIDLDEQDLKIIQQMIAATEEVGQAQNQNNAQQKVNEQFQQRMNSESKAKGVTSWISGLTSMIFLLQSATSLIDTLNNEDLTIAEKASAILSGLMIMLPMATMALESFSIAKMADVTVTSILTGATGALTTAVRALGLAITSLPVIGQIALAITAVIAAIAGLITIIDNFILKTDEANKEYKNQLELLKNLQSNYEELSSSVQELRQSIESLEQKKNALSELEEGTIEWKQAVLELNEQVLSLLETYPKLAEYINSENGVLSISEEGLDTLYNEQMQKVQTAQNMITVQQVRTRQNASDVAIENFANEHRWLAGGQGIDTNILENVINGLNDSSLTIEEACKSLGLNVEENGTDLRILAEKVQSNNVAIDNLNSTFSEVGNYISFAINPDADMSYQKAYDNLEKKYGENIFHSGGFFQDSAIISALDQRNNTVNQEEFRQLAQESLPELRGAITSISEATDNWDWVVRTDANEEIRLTKEMLHEKMALYQSQLEIEQQKLDFDKEVYEALGAKWNEETQNFEGGFQLNEQQNQLIKDYQNNIKVETDKGTIGFADYINSLDNGIKSVEDFAKALADTNGELFNFTEELGNVQGAISLSDLDYEYEKSDKTFTDTENYNNKLDELTKAASEAYDIDIEDITDQAKAFREELELTEGAARDLAIQNQRMTKGIDALHDNWEDWLIVLQNSNHMAKDYIDTSQEVTKAIANLVGASDDLDLSNEFFESAQNLEDIALAADGDIEAINRLGIAVGKDLVEAMEAVSREASGLDFSDADTEQVYANMVEEFNNAKSTVMNGLDELQAQINNLGVGQNVYDILGGQDWVNALNTMAEQTQMSVEDMNSLLGSIGVQADVTVKDVKTKVQVPQYKTTEEIQMVEPPNPLTGGFGKYEKITSTQYMGSKEMDGVVSVAQINTGDKAGTPPTINYVGNGPVSYSSTPSGRDALSSNNGSSSPKSSTPKTPKEEKPKNNQAKENAKNEWDYLTDITNDLDRQAAIIEKLSKLEDRLYGANRVSQLKKLQSEYKKNIKLLQEEAKLAEKHAKRLRTNAYDENGNLTINAYANRAGFSQIGFDAKGNIENGKAIEAALTQKVNNAIAEYNIHRNDEDDNTVKYYEEQVRLAQEDHDGFMKALSEYESTLGVIEDSQSQIQEYKEKIQDAADAIVDTIQESIKNVIETIDKRRDFNRSVREWREGGEGYSHFRSDRRYFSEGLQEFFNSKSGINGQSNLNISLNNLRKRLLDVEDVFDINRKDKKSADDEKLSQTQALEKLNEATELVSDNINTIVENYNSLLDTIGEMSSKMDDIIEDRLQQYDNIEDFLDTRLDQLKLLFGEDYGAQVRFYNQKINNNMSKMVDINTAIKEKQATVEQLEKLESSNKKLSTENRQMLNDARNEITKLQQELNVTAKETNQLIKDRLGDQTRGEMQKMTNDMFGGNDVEWIAQQWEIASRNSSQYLDDYNRAFELQKLQLKYQDLLNDSQETSLSIQQRISVHMNDQLGFLRNKKKLSEYDVQYAQKQLEILQKQIALEEARDNKSQMRLQRNAAGNYDFVYAADENAVNQATEALLNAQQEAYNLSKKIYLDTYNSAVEAALKTKETVVEIALDASIDTAEKQERIKYVLDNLKEYMDNSSVELKNISINLYNDFIEADNKIAEENLGALSEVYQKIKDEYIYALEEMKNSSNDTVISMQEQYADALKKMETSSDNAITSMKNHLSNYLGTEGEGQVPGTARYVFNQFDTLGNTTFNNLVQNSNNAWSDISTNVKSTLDNKMTPDLENMFGRTGILAEYFGNTEEYSNKHWDGLSTYISGTTLPKITGDMKTAFLESGGSNDSIEGIVNLALSSINSNFEITETKSLEKVDSIDSAVDTAYTNIIEYLNKYSEKNDLVLEKAGTSYATFIEDSLNVATDATKKLSEKTQDFKRDLEYLKNEITKTTTETGKWEKKIDDAYAAIDPLLGHAYTLEQLLYADAYEAAIATDNFDYLADAADGVKSSFSTMASEIGNAYGALKDAASDAATAYNDLAAAAGNAEQAAYDATNAINSIPNPPAGVTIDSVSGAEDLLRSTGQDIFNAMQSALPYLPVLTNLGGNRNISPLKNSPWGGLGFDSGGYTGTWTNGGIDDKNGKWAILHQKELVLNKTDTENMLSAVEIIRDIVSDANKLTSFGKINNSSNFNDTIEQRVEISATFPGVTEAIEIKQALEQLADNAYQVASRYKY